MNFRLRLTLLFAGLCFLLFALISAGAYWAFASAAWKELDQKLVPRGESLAGRIEISGDRASAPGGFGKGGLEERIDVVFSLAGKILLATSGIQAAALQPSSALSPQLMEGQVVLQDLQLVDGTAVRVAYIPLLRDGKLTGVLATAIPRESTERSLSNLAITLLVANAILLVLAAVIGWLLARSVLQPVKRMRQLAEEISLQDLEKRISLEGPRDELYALAATFDSMLDRLQKAVTADKQFFAESSHELRTPLTIIQGNLDLALRNPLATTDELRQTLRLARDETEAMSRIVADLLFLARSDTQALEMVRETVPLRALLEEVVQLLTPLAQEKTIRLEIAGEDVPFRGDRGLLQRMLLNLGENAIRYHQKEGWVRFGLVRENQSIRICVEDNGWGIPSEEYPLLFTRFFRGIEAKRQEPQGTGLGLAIIAEIARRHGGTVEVRSQSGEGSCFTVVFPVASIPTR
ncbi:MAG: ATP-binding protein [Coprothermobacterota bacterium]|nr:ATP-binding protein [Coprothermobacterota bacterium]